MVRLFAALLVVNALGFAWATAHPLEVTAGAEVVATTETDAVELAWRQAQAHLDAKCPVEFVTGVEDVERISNGYRAHVIASGVCS